MRTQTSVSASDSVQSRRVSDASNPSSTGSSGSSSPPPWGTPSRFTLAGLGRLADVDFDWKWVVGLVIAVIAFVGSGLYISLHGERTQGDVNQNQESIAANQQALVQICSSMTVLGIVFEQLQFLDKQIAADKTISPGTRLRVRQRAGLYAVAVEGLNETNRGCEKIE